MTPNLLNKQRFKPLVFLFADPDALGLSILEKLLTNFCDVEVITGKEELWHEKTELFSKNNLLKISSLNSKFDKEEPLSYLIFVNNNLTRTFREAQIAVGISNKILGKKFVVFPYSVLFSEKRIKLIEQRLKFVNECPDAEFFYIGDIFGPAISRRADNQVYLLLSRFIFQKSLPKENLDGLYPLLARDIANEIVKFLFSFGPPGKETFILGKKISISGFSDYLGKLYPSIVAERNYDFPKILTQGEGEKIVVDTNLYFATKETINWFETNPPQKEEKTIELRDFIKEKFRFPKINFNLVGLRPKIKKISLKPIKKIANVKIALYSIFAAAVILVMPFIFLGLSLLGLKLSYRYAVEGKISVSSSFSRFAGSFARLSQKEMEILTPVPVLGRIYADNKYLPEFVKKGVDAASRLYKVYLNLSILPKNILGNEIYSIEPILKNSSLELDVIYKELGFIQGEIESLPSQKSKFIYKYIDKSLFSTLRENIYWFKTIVQNLGSILGERSPQTYLVLFQNNMELRPTGGFIGSFALVTFDKGRISGMDVQDVYSADGQLKGHVEPPEAIRKYLGEASWYLRDSNWDPDFPKSALKAEWFLDKEIDKKVDGVVAIDLEAVKEILKVLGPVYLSDYSKLIDYKNIYQVTQSEVEENFFPGSRKKSSLLTALSKEILNLVSENLDKEKIGIFKSIVKGLEEKHIQIYLHNDSVQKAVSALGYDGSFKISECNENCYYNFVSYIDSNLGVNKANYFVKRSVSLSSFIDEGKTKNVLRILIENSANPALGDRVRYKTFLRVFTNLELSFDYAKVYSLGEENFIDIEKEDNKSFLVGGVPVTVMPNEKKTIEFSFSGDLKQKLDFLKKGKIGFFLRKQAGTEGDSININLFLPNYARIASDSLFTLTRQGTYVYNTLLTRDIFPLIYWY